MAVDTSAVTDAAIGAFLTSWANAKSSKERDLLAMQMQDLLSKRNAALTESGRDPFRQQVQQAGDASKLSLMANSRYSPVSRVGASTPYDANIPDLGGGFSYQDDPKIHDAAAKLEGDVLAGHAAPTMTNPDNYGHTAALDLSGDPSSPSYGQPSADDGNAAKGPQDSLSGFTQGFGHGGFDPTGAFLMGYKLWQSRRKKKQPQTGTIPPVAGAF